MRRLPRSSSHAVGRRVPEQAPRLADIGKRMAHIAGGHIRRRLTPLQMRIATAHEVPAPRRFAWMELATKQKSRDDSPAPLMMHVAPSRIAAIQR